MPTSTPLKIGIIALLVAFLGGALFLFLGHKTPAPLPPPPAPVATTTPPLVASIHGVVGKSVQGRAIEEYSFGTGAKHLLFVGGMHGGYEWNSVLVAYSYIDYLSDPKNVPDGFTISVIPAANPDGVYQVIGKEGRFTVSDVPSVVGKPADYGRLNADGVDLNRNFACHWKPKSMWRGTVVSAGKSAFSEPEARVIRDAVASDTPLAVVFWHSQSGTVYASQCDKGILPDTLSIMNAYAKAAGYATSKAFNAYAITGDSEGWLASIGIPALTVELTTHESIDWEKNLAGVNAVIDFYRQKGSTTPVK